jgi:hypothetical protein
MSKSFDWTILGRKVHAYLSDFKGDRGYEKGWHGRLSLYFDEACRRAFSAEYHVPSHRYSVSFRASHDDTPLKASLNVGLFGVYVSAEHPALSKVRDAIIKAWPLARQAYTFSGRDFSVAFHDHGVFWSLGADDMGWSSGTPKWRHGAWHPLGHFMRQGEPEVVETREVLVPMPERSYKAIAKLERSRWGFGKLPRAFDRIGYHVDIEMQPGEQVPVPGKGENSHDCGEDASFAMSCPASTIEEGVGKLVASALRDRYRRAGPKWVPEGDRTPHDQAKR